MENYTKMIVIIIICSILLLLVRKNSKAEHLTLKTECDERNRSCFIACTKSGNTLDVACYNECVRISPIC